MLEYSSIALACVSALVGYLGSPGQRWRAIPLPGRPSRAIAACLAILAVFAGAQAWQWATALAVTLTVQMTCFVALPFLGALWQGRRPGIAER